MSVARFFDTRSAYTMFVTATNEKTVVAGRIGAELERVRPGERALRLFDAGMGDGSVLTQVMRRMHQDLPHVPWLVVGKEISIEDVRQALERLPDRFFEHPEMVFVVTNMSFRDAPDLSPQDTAARTGLGWREVALEGGTAHEFASQIRSLYPSLVHDWEVRTSPTTGNPLYVRPSVLVLYRKDREFLLRPIIPDRDGGGGGYDLVVASQPYRARTSVERKTRGVVVPLARALAPGGRLIVIHAHGQDAGLEIIRGVWPDEDPFRVGRRQMLAAASRRLTEPGDATLVFEAAPDEEAIFPYQLHAMPSEVAENIGTSLVMAAWNAAAYVAQIDEPRLSAAVTSGAYFDATRSVLRRHGGVWFNDEAYVISRSPG
ncbi:MAG: hypothetical protein ACE5GC_07110 [Acidimicrobiia bacterium]